jgi:hypothetical protein
MGNLPKAVEPVYHAVSSLASQTHLGEALAELRQSLRIEDSAPRQLAAVRKFIRAGAGESDELKGIFQKLRHEIAGASAQDFLRLFQPLIDKDPRR